jgi:3-hydroxybutyrate dehydrogenase
MLKGKTALVTGSTSGIGLGIAKMLAKEGCNIMLNGFGDPLAIDAHREIIAHKHSVEVHYMGANLMSAEESAELVQETIAEFGSIDILVNNAGIQHVAPVEDFPDEKWQDIIALNLSAAFYTTKQAVPAMRKQGWGRIINIASAHGKVASANKSGYVAAKHGLIGLTKVIGLETAQDDITCNAICPGWVLTPLVQQQIDDWAERDGISVDEAGKLLLGEKQPSGNFVTPQDIGAMALYLCSDAAGQVTGTDISIDGGWTAQ